MPLTRIQTDAIKDAITSSNIADGTITVADVSSTAYGLIQNSFRNKIINGAMNISQRGTTPLTGLGTYNYRLLDFHRTGGGNQVTGKYSIAQKDSIDSTSTAYEANSAPPGFRYSMKFSVDTAYSASTDVALYHSTFIEGLYAVDTAWGTSSAKTCTLSFWVKSSTTGTMEVMIHNNTSPACTYRAAYTINAANTWEYKTITIPGPTVGTWVYTNAQAGIRIDFTLWNGTSGNSSNLVNTWYNNDATSGIISGRAVPFSASAANIYFTGMQFEVGSTATPFEHRPLTTELSLCQRYYYNTYQNGISTGVEQAPVIGSVYYYQSGAVHCIWKHPVRMRATPSVTFYESHINIAPGNTTFSSPNVTADSLCYLTAANTTVNAYPARTHMAFSAEF
jgi:hypothetical protein